VGSLIAASRAAGKQLKDQIVTFLGQVRQDAASRSKLLPKWWLKV
jgi:hypothetical protein